MKVLCRSLRVIGVGLAVLLAAAGAGSWGTVAVAQDAAASQSKVTADDILKALDPQGTAAPFVIVDRESVTGVTIPANAILVRGQFSITGDAPYQNHFVIKTIGKTPAKGDAVAEWLEKAQIGQTELFGVQKFKKVRENKYSLVSERATVTVQSNAEAARSRVRTGQDRVSENKITEARDKVDALSLRILTDGNGTSLLLLNARKRGVAGRIVRIETIEVAIDGETVAVPVREDDMLPTLSDDPWDSALVDVSENLALHGLLAKIDDSREVTVRFRGDKEWKDDTLSPDETPGLKAVLTTFYVRRMDK